jgi:hypothetical protein
MDSLPNPARGLPLAQCRKLQGKFASISDEQRHLKQKPWKNSPMIQ